MTAVWSALADLVLPVECAGCRAPHERLTRGVCARCAAELSALRPVPLNGPLGAPRDGPRAGPFGGPLGGFAMGEYAGPLREAILSYKERGRTGLAGPLGVLLAEAIAAAAGSRPRPVLLVAIPSTGRAARTRYGDHLRRLVVPAARRLRRAGWPVAVVRPLRARPRPDATELDVAGRAAAAARSLRIRESRVAATRRAARTRTVVLVDDIVTTGATLTTATDVLEARGIPVDAVAVLASTRRRHPG